MILHVFISPRMWSGDSVVLNEKNPKNRAPVVMKICVKSIFDLYAVRLRMCDAVKDVAVNLCSLKVDEAIYVE
jgi:hypothetical protein